MPARFHLDARRPTPAVFDHADVPWRRPIDLPDRALAPTEVRPGDVLFSRRPGWYQRLNAIAGDTWRHVALAVEVHGRMWAIETGPHGHQARPIETFVGAYDTVALLRLDRCAHGCRSGLVDVALGWMTTPTRFPRRRDLAVMGTLAFLRLVTDPRSNDRADRLAWRLANRWPGDRGAGFGVCSTLVAEGAAAFCDRHRLRVDLRAGKRRPMATRSFDLPAEPLLTMPDDLWHGLPARTPYWLKLNGALAVDPAPAQSMPDVIGV